MTEAEWLACGDLGELFLALRLFPPTKRKYRFCSVAFCLRLKASLLSEPVKAALIVAANFADGLASEDDIVKAYESVVDPFSSGCVLRAVHRRQRSTDAEEIAEESVFNGSLDEDTERRIHIALFRDIFGNPFRPVTFLPEWRTSTAVALAGQMYESRDFGAMPILADALQDAGCDSADVLDHCRGKGPHVRGCWVVDSILEKV
ncbi:hypothetical protein VT84_23755 [Gemmata sp. SH-PL17]|uniref:hypothetical protein n=1 Tax=Gemmata sp. SH-PL17 TaxID=1630693 RepID=UPI0006988D47|nr:hypothetical protein [Gemmata sp. SH-PL17]AMV27436.1 hypothetical protein VT84_23755 [Gemmata sp. SH-PL17]